MANDNQAGCHWLTTKEISQWRDDTPALAAVKRMAMDEGRAREEVAALDTKAVTFRTLRQVLEIVSTESRKKLDERFAKLKAEQAKQKMKREGVVYL